MSALQKTAGKDVLEIQLCDLLRESPDDALRRERDAFDRAAQSFGERLVLFGAGSLGKSVLRKMVRVGLIPLAFVDNNPALWGTSIDAIPVYSPREAAERFGRDAAFLVTIWNARGKDRMSQRVQQLLDLGCRCVLPVGLFFWKYPQTFLPYFHLDLPHKALQSSQDIKAGFYLFSEEASRREYVAQVAFRLLLDYDGLTLAGNAGHYLPSTLVKPRVDETFVDCGAFDGDTIVEFVERYGPSFSSIVAFEPDPVNWEKLQRRIEQLPNEIRRKTFAFPHALGARKETVYFMANGTDQSRAGSGSIAVECVTLDQALLDFAPTWIKFDIEGAELGALEGAREVISRCRPVLAVSAYHEQNHLWRVPLLLSHICKDYEFLLRPTGSEGWDLLCYAVPRERLNSAE